MAYWSCRFLKVSQAIFPQIHDRLCHLFEIENLCLPLESGKINFLRFRLNVNGQIGLELYHRSCFGRDNPFARNALHDRHFGVICTKRITAHKLFAIRNFERLMSAPFDLRALRFRGGEEAVKILAAVTEGGVNLRIQLAPDNRRLILSQSCAMAVPVGLRFRYY